MHAHSFLWHYLWLAPHALQIFIVIVMVRRGLVREFPIFFTYTLFQIVEEGTLFILDHSAAIRPLTYWSAHWVGLAVDVTLRFAIIAEIFSRVLGNYPGLRRLSGILFRAASVILLFAAIVIAARAPEDGTRHIISRIHVFDLAVSIMQSGLLLLLLGFSSYLGVSARNFAYGIAFGFGIFASVDLATETLRVWTGSIAGFTFDLVTMATYHCCVLIWLVYVLAPEKSGRPVKKLPANNLEQWNAELQRLLLQ